MLEVIADGFKGLIGPFKGVAGKFDIKVVNPINVSDLQPFVFVLVPHAVPVAHHVADVAVFSCSASKRP